ncbi:hypothetical protein [Nostoc sp. ChiSLP03a]|nr:hypothetical protein [Nostoc sp. ChiSLP03a]MDZ8216634.1 hypothetical protein [Nostoc sp. ChiSLP03a]
MTRAVGVLSKIASDRPKRQIIAQASEISKGIVTNSTFQVKEVHPSPT